ncbi:ABC transporter ATP-binding protein [Sporosalibacterium faouarense]|uniref:ABC transporter ATP-binding protein n=1 Tax=Sporosalibacterium faouarense TaxID=516123 RepID=UPI00192CC4AE|nr:ABC transporter ATP-binding protein [Sporosalibacterium faouarense]
MNSIEVKNITKYYGNTKALDDVSITIEPNKIYGLLGRNGAGKTTLLNLLTNKIFPNKGNITLDGESIFENDKALNNIFYMMEKNLFPETMKVKEVFKWTKEFYTSFDDDYAKSLSGKFGLNINKKVKGLSTGYTSIFKAILALASNANVLLLDEPVLGLDANHRDLLYKELLTSYNERPKTIIISTHLIEEVSEVLEEAIIIKAGKILAKKSVEELLESAYTVSGEASNVDSYISGKEYIGEETMGRFKSVTVLENSSKQNKELARKLDLEFSNVELQKLFINLTN